MIPQRSKPFLRIKGCQDKVLCVLCREGVGEAGQHNRKNRDVMVKASIRAMCRHLMRHHGYDLPENVRLQQFIHGKVRRKFSARHVINTSDGPMMAPSKKDQKGRRRIGRSASRQRKF